MIQKLGTMEMVRLKISYIPVSRYVTSLSKNHMRATFFVDMANYIYLSENDKGSDDLHFFQETIHLLFRNGMDVQFHLHPQWLPRIYNPLERIDSRWNIGLLTSVEISFLVSKGKQILEDIGHPKYITNDLIEAGIDTGKIIAYHKVKTSLQWSKYILLYRRINLSVNRLVLGYELKGNDISSGATFYKIHSRLKALLESL